MLEKIKIWVQTAKDMLLYVIGPVAALAAYVYYLLSKKRELEDKLSQTESEKELAETLAKKKEAENEATQAATDYDTLRDAFLKQSKSRSDDHV